MNPCHRLPLLIFFAFFLSTGGALAQAVGPDEAVRPNGGVFQNLSLTPTQRNAIYNAIAGRRGRTSAPQIAATIGAPVPPSVALRDLPDPAATDTPEAGLLKYAMVADDVVVVDPIQMRVVDVIRGRPSNR
jgi:hypothetical protein